MNFTRRKTNWLELVITIIVAAVLVLGFSAFTAWIVGLLWNNFMPLIWITAPKFTFLQTWGLMTLFTLLGSMIRSRK